MSRIVLWVDDDGPLRFRYERRLLEQNGWKVKWAHDLSEALVALSTERFDALILDHHLPVDGKMSLLGLWSGATILAWLRGFRDDRLLESGSRPGSLVPLASNRNLPTCFVSGFFDADIEETIRSNEESGLQTIMLPKPVDSEHLIDFLRSIE